MTVEWSLGGPDILLTLDRNAGPIGTRIQDQLRAAIRERRVGAGERLPSTRRLAELFGVARGTVVEVYEQLLAEGYVESAVGSGTRVAAVPPGGSSGRGPRLTSRLRPRRSNRPRSTSSTASPISARCR